MSSLVGGFPWLEAAALTLVAIATSVQLFVPPIVGLADNRDYGRVMAQIGVDYCHGAESTVFYNIQRTFCLSRRKEFKYLTTETLIGRSAVAVNRIVRKDGHFDIRVMGGANLIFYLGALGLFLAAFRRDGWPTRLGVALFAVVVFSDVQLVTYFNSFYSESAQLIFALSTVGLALLAGRGGWPTYVAFLVSSVLFALAKNQNIVFCLPLAVVAAGLMPGKRRIARVAVAAGFVCLLVWGMTSDAWAETRNINPRVNMEEELLLYNGDPTAVLQEIGGGDYAKVTNGRIALFYLRHPDRWWALAIRRMGHINGFLSLGHFEKPRSGQSKHFAWWSQLKVKHWSRSIYFYLALIILYGVVLTKKWRYFPHERHHVFVGAMLVTSCILQYVIAATFEANGPSKHLFIFNVLLDLACLLGLRDLKDVAIRDFASARATVTPAS